MTDIRLKSSALLLALAMTILLAPTLAPNAKASGIVAVVNGAAITDLDITQRQKLERLLSGGKRRLSKSAALNAMIDDKLKLLEARDRNRTPSDSDIESALGNMARNAKISTKRMIGIFRQAGVNKETLKDWLRAQLAWRSLIRARFNAQIRVDEAEIMQALNEKGESRNSVESTIQFDLTSVLFVARAKNQNLRLREAKRFRDSFQSCDTDLEKARRLTDVAVTRVGRRESGALPPAISKTLRDTPVNRLTQPRKTDTGYEMLAVCGKKDLGKEATLRDEIETKLKDDRSKALSRKYLAELRARAVIEKR
ncbi:SurA N-terminal domain-containing protein [Cohaesibacter intestini]|uniref:SurA N-terminal domain-containing protein n=1 Tax=Cohaesibacter intestini TaxID=2211145 RepID=UPI000DEBDBFD|nr:SurA N-terminal domain-containing protein [Cohaesibacter intestini]